jgi:hypothetical protein
MRKAAILFSLLVLFACGGLKITPESQGVSSVSDSSQCKFVKSLFMQAMPYNMVQGVQQHALNAGGDAYKIISTTPTKMIGLDMVNVNFEIYKCK